jgi:hypothetical protein
MCSRVFIGRRRRRRRRRRVVKINLDVGKNNAADIELLSGFGILQEASVNGFQLGRGRGCEDVACCRSGAGRGGGGAPGE